MIDIGRMINGSHPTLLEFYATWCPHCQKMMPIVEDLKELYAGRKYHTDRRRGPRESHE